MIKISIVTISYNQGCYLPFCVASVLGQLMDGDEYIIVDPGSVDGSREYIQSIARTSPFIRTVFKADNGPASGLNNGFSVASGNVFAYINADDCLLPGALDYVRDFFEKKSDVDVLVGAIKIMDEYGVMRRRGRVADVPSSCRIAAECLQYYQPGTFFRRNIFFKAGGFNEKNRIMWDFELIVDMFIAGALFIVVSKPLSVFRIHGASITGSGGQQGKKFADELHRVSSKLNDGSGGWARRGIRLYLRFEARCNPVRILRQLRPS